MDPGITKYRMLHYKVFNLLEDNINISSFGESPCARGSACYPVLLRRCLVNSSHKFRGCSRTCVVYLDCDRHNFKAASKTSVIIKFIEQGLSANILIW